MDPEIIIFLTNFGAILGAILGPNPLKKGSQNWTSFGTPRRRILGVQMMRFCELNESGKIAIAIGIIFAKRKGGIGALYSLYSLQRKYGPLISPWVPWNSLKLRA